MTKTKMKNNKIEPSDKQTFIEHLAEFRKRIIYSIIALLFFTIFSFKFSQIIVKDMIAKAPNMNFVFLAPTELFMAYIKIALIGGIVLSLPVILYNIWLFLKPGLEIDDRTTIIGALFSGGILFVFGSIFGYLVILPITIEFFASFQIDEVLPMISFNNYLSFAISMILSFGIAFEIPILIVIIVKLRLVSTEFLKKNRKFVVIITLIASAIITPPDVVSQIMLAIPLLLLFEIGLLLGTRIEKARKQN